MRTPERPAEGISIYENFVSKEELQQLNAIFDTEKDKFFLVEGSVNVIGFGQDNFHESYFFDNPSSVSNKLPNHLELIKAYSERLEQTIRGDSDLDTVLSVLWFVEKFNGGFPAHGDNEPGVIYAYDKTCILYLTDCIDGGEISFPDYGYTYAPRAGSLVSFPAEYIHEVSPVSAIRRAMPSWFTQDKKYAFSNYLK
jgi:hypothetical protein